VTAMSPRKQQRSDWSTGPEAYDEVIKATLGIIKA